MIEQYIDNPSLKKIRKNLWSIAKEKHIVLEDIQDRTKFSYSQVYRIVRGTNSMSVSGFIAVCKALEVQPAEVLNFKIKIPNYPPTRKDLTEVKLVIDTELIKNVTE
jgi:DNA-binding Xre family transcriptional regulator